MNPIAQRWVALKGRERAVIIVLCAIALLGIVYAIFVRGGGGPEPFSRPTPTLPRRAASPAPSPARSPVPETFDVFEGKDPFRPLIAEPAPVSPTPRGTPAPTGSPTPGPDGGPSTGQRVSLLDIFIQGSTRYATVEVDGETFTVKEGDRFAGNFRVLDLTAKCGTFVFGDERFTLCIGQEVIK